MAKHLEAAVWLCARNQCQSENKSISHTPGQGPCRVHTNKYAEIQVYPILNLNILGVSSYIKGWGIKKLYKVLLTFHFEQFLLWTSV